LTKKPIFNYTKSLFYKIWLTICASIIIATVASSFLVYIQVSTQMKQQMQQKLLWEAYFYRQQLEEVFLRVALKLDTMVHSSAAVYANYAFLQDEMDVLHSQSPNVIRSWVAYPNGTLIPSPNTNLDYVKNLPWWHEYLSGQANQTFTGNLLGRSQSLVGRTFVDQSDLTTLVPLLSVSLQGTKIIRAAGAQVDLNGALTSNTDVDVDWSNIPVSIYTNTGILVACPYRYYKDNLKFPNKINLHPLIREMLTRRLDESGFKIYLQNNRKMAGVFLMIPSLNLVLIVEYPATEVVDPLLRIASGPLIIIILLLLVATITIIMIYYNTKRLRRVEDLARSAELRALQARINPHFLFNTLDCLVGLAVSTGNNSLIKIIRSLINIFRYTIRKMDELVPLEEELNYLEEYVSLQQIRYGSRFTLELSVPNEFLNIKIFKFCIQPLVENCFIHGVEKSLDPISIRVQATRNKNILEICVLDDGPGMTPNRLQEIRDSLKHDTYESSNHGHGVGVSNIHHRLQYAYGPRYGIRFQPLNPGLAVYLSFPVMKTDL
jgi:hypothetical protein